MRANPPSSDDRIVRAFSLIELLVGMALLALLGVLVIQIVSATSQTVRLSNQLVDAASQARLVFDRVRLDLAGLVCREDVDFSGGNSSSLTGGAPGPELVFLATVLSPGSDRALSAIAYQLGIHADNNNRHCLLRGARAVPWSAAQSYMGLDGNGIPRRVTAWGSLLPQSSDFQVLAPGAITVVFGFQLSSSGQSMELESGDVVTADGQVVYSMPMRTVTSHSGATQKIPDISAVAAIVVGVVTLDLKSLGLLTPEQVTELAGKFVRPAAVPSNPNQQLPSQLWTPIANDVAALGSTLPLSARQSVRVFERFFPINPQSPSSL